LLWGAVVAVVLGGAAVVFREELLVAALAVRIAPDHDFDPARVPAAPDYARDSAWAALPDKKDPSDDTPQAMGAGPAPRGSVAHGR